MDPTGGERRSRRVWALRAIRAAVTALAFAWVLTRIEVAQVVAAMLRVPLTSLALAAVLLATNVAVLGTIRWRALMEAYGAGSPPSLARLATLNLIGFFYNTWLPGGVGGDVVRGVASREAFAGGPAGETEAARATGGVAVVLVERTLGLVGLLILSGAASLVGGRSIPGLLAWSAMGIGAGVGAIAALALASSLGPRLPGALGRMASSLPGIARPSRFVIAIAISIVIHGLVAAIGHLAITSLAPAVTLAQSMVIVPVAMATQFLPITIGGAGAREVAFVVLYGAIGVAEGDALAASLIVLLVNLAVSAIGGVLPVTRAATPA